LHLWENNNNGLEVNATHILLCGGPMQPMWTGQQTVVKFKKKKKQEIKSAQIDVCIRTEGPLRPVILATFALHHCAIQLHATDRVYFNDFKFVWRRLQRFANCIFFLNNCFLLTKKMFNDFHLVRNKLGRFTCWYQRFSTVYHGFVTLTLK